MPELGEEEKYYCSLFSRKKYANNWPHPRDKGQLKRFVSTKERLFSKIKQLEVKLGDYQLYDLPVQPESLALYIMPNPRDLKKATYNTIIELTELMRDGKKDINPHSIALNCIQKSVGRKHFVDFDVDYKPFDVQKLDGLINRDCVDILETRGGFHLLVRVEQLEAKYKKTYYKGILELNVDQTGDQMIPVPGCYQGGFMPKFVTL